MKNKKVNLRIIIKSNDLFSVDEIVQNLSKYSGIDIKQKPYSFEIDEENFLVWENILVNDDASALTMIKNNLRQELDAYVSYEKSSWWKRNSKPVVISLGGSSLAGLIVGVFSILTHPPH